MKMLTDKTREELIAEWMLRRGYQPARDDAEVDVTTGTSIRALAELEVDDMLRALRLYGPAELVPDTEITSPALARATRAGASGAASSLREW